MIGGIHSHGRTKKDTRYLIAHLLKDKDVRIEFINSAASGLPEILRDMEISRDSTRADAAFMHMYLSPARHMTDVELRRAAKVVVSHLGGTEHQAALVYHGKDRRGGDGDRHLHIVLGRVGPEGEMLPHGFDVIKMETAVRIAEYELGEQPTLGRHHASAVQWLQKNGREDVASRLIEAFGEDPEKPKSMASPGKRKELERLGINTSVARDQVQAAWTLSDSPKSFAAALAEVGLTAEPGRKDGVWIVKAGEVEIGSLDRIIKDAKRKEISQKMKGYENATTPPTPTGNQTPFNPADPDDDNSNAPTPTIPNSPAGNDRQDPTPEKREIEGTKDYVTTTKEPEPRHPDDRISRKGDQRRSVEAPTVIGPPTGEPSTGRILATHADVGVDSGNSGKHPAGDRGPVSPLRNQTLGHVRVEAHRLTRLDFSGLKSMAARIQQRAKALLARLKTPPSETEILKAHLRELQAKQVKPALHEMSREQLLAELRKPKTHNHAAKTDRQDDGKPRSLERKLEYKPSVHKKTETDKDKK